MFELAIAGTCLWYTYLLYQIGAWEEAPLGIMVAVFLLYLSYLIYKS